MYRNHAKRLSFAFIALLLGPVLGVPGSFCQGQASPSAMEILEKSKATHVPTVSYSASVEQTVTTQPSGSKGPDQPSCIGRVVFEPGKGLQRIKSSDDQTRYSQPQIKVIVDLGTFLDEMLSCPGVNLEEADVDGRPHHLLTGLDATKETRLLIWVDQEFYRISQILLEIKEQQYAEIAVEYADAQRGYWLPHEIELHHFNDDSRITLSFSEYSLR